MSARHGTVAALRPAPRGTGQRQAQTTANLTALTEMMAEDRIILLKEAAVLLGVSTVTLQSWRSSGTGPAPIVVNRRARGYRLGTLKEWVRQHERGHGES
jgi:predicted DNA-binding transcriptional regulator AlpA